MYSSGGARIKRLSKVYSFRSLSVCRWFGSGIAPVLCTKTVGGQRVLGITICQWILNSGENIKLYKGTKISSGQSKLSVQLIGAKVRGSLLTIFLVLFVPKNSKSNWNR